VILYLDSSALVNLFVVEWASEGVHELVAQAVAVATSRIAYVEACAAFARRRREERLTKHEYATAREVLKDQWPAFAAVELNEFNAGELAMKHSLRGFDAVHLAAALEIRSRANGSPVVFCSFDTLQREAARAESFSVVPEAESAFPPSEQNKHRPVPKRRRNG